MTLSINRQTHFTQNHSKYNNVTPATKTGALIGSIAGVGTALTYVAKGHGLKPAVMFMQPARTLKTFKNIELKGKEVIAIASSSILGGFIGGSVTDGKNSKYKAKEGIVQLIGNYIIPTLFVSGGIKMNKIMNKKFNFPPVVGPALFGCGMASLIAGVITGNAVSKGLNRRLFNEDSPRKINWKDWALQFDNVCLVTSISNSGTNIAKIASRLIPIAHILPGYLTGIQKKN